MVNSVSDIKGVLFDFGNTLAYVDEEADRRYREELLSILKAYGYVKTLEDLFPLLDSAYRSSTEGEVRSLYHFWKLFLNKLDMSANQALIRELQGSRTRHVDKTFKLYDGVFKVLSTLKESYKLALVSNCAVGLSDVIESLGLTSFFQCIVLSYEVGVRKPDRRIYLVATQSLGLQPRDCVFVADEVSDLVGAREVGLKTILVHQEKYTTLNDSDLNFTPDLRCDRVSEILKFF